MRNRIMPNDTVRFKPTGETWQVCGVNHLCGHLIPCGYPFPTLADLEDCELIELHYENEPQTEDEINALLRYQMYGFIDARSAMFHGIEIAVPKTFR